MATKSIKINSTVKLISLVAVILIYLIVVFFFAKWCFAHSIATRAATKDAAELAVEMAPSDPQSYYSLAVLNERNFQPEDLKKALQAYETATALSPYDFRLWLELGIARGQNGDEKGSEKALRRALELAPNYAEIHWALGNKLARQNRIEEGFEKIRFAAQSNPKFIKPAISTAWLIFDADLAQVKKHIGDFPQLNAELAMYLAEQNDFDGAIEIWNKLPVENKKNDLKSSGEKLFAQMLNAKKYRYAFQINKQINADAENMSVGTVYNGGFEADVDPTKPGVFEWQLAKGLTPQIGFDDTQKRGGKRSLVILFNTDTNTNFRTVSQMIVVEPEKSYELEVFYRADLETKSDLKWAVVEAADQKVIASSEPIEKKTDWTNLKVSFKTDEDTEAVIIRLVREGCITSICPIMGKVWFDDISITSIGARTSRPPV